MTDLFDEKAADWDAGDMKQKLSNAIGSCIAEQIDLKADQPVRFHGICTVEHTFLFPLP